jgi:cytochrome P450
MSQFPEVSGPAAPAAHRKSATSHGFYPPAPNPLSPVVSLMRLIWQGDGDLLSLLPREAYAMPIGPLGYSRRQIVIVNDPRLFRPILADTDERFPKSDLMVDALRPLVGNSIFVSGGADWQRQRRMIDPAFTHMRIQDAFGAMQAGVDAFEQVLLERAQRNESFPLDVAMSHLTADIICRTVFSTSLEGEISRRVFEAFTRFESSIAQVRWKTLIFDPAWTQVPPTADVLAACNEIRTCLGSLLDTHFQPRETPWNDIASEMIAAVDPVDGVGFTRDELLDQLGVMFLAGHETTASALTWAFYIISQHPEVARRIRQEVQEICGSDTPRFEHIRGLTYTRNVFRETLRLYPPITFLPRVSAENTSIDGYKIKRGAMVMISPWTIHRNPAYWPDPHRFDPDRFDPAQESNQVAGAYLPFGLGPRVCVGAAFAATEASLILARLCTRFDFETSTESRIRPIARMTTRPNQQINARARVHHVHQ